jgi:hypothetical protein
MNLWPFRLLFKTPPRKARPGRRNGEIMDLPYLQREHNVQLRAVLPDKADEIQEADERSEAIYDQIDEHVVQLRKVRAAIAKKKSSQG